MSAGDAALLKRRRQTSRKRYLHGETRHVDERGDFGESDQPSMEVGRGGGNPVFGRVESRIGIGAINRVTQVVRMVPGEHELVLGEILGPLHP